MLISSGTSVIKTEQFDGENGPSSEQMDGIFFTSFVDGIFFTPFVDSVLV